MCLKYYNACGKLLNFLDHTVEGLAGRQSIYSLFSNKYTVSINANIRGRGTGTKDHLSGRKNFIYLQKSPAEKLRRVRF